MGFLGDAKEAAQYRAEEAAADAAFKEGGYPGLFKYKIMLTYMSVTTTCGCA